MGEFDENQVLANPIVIVGAPRSGTSFLGRILSKHPDVHYLDEPRLTWRYGNDRKSDYLRPDDAQPEVIAHIRRTFAAHAHAAGKSRIVEKTPSNSLRLGFVHRVFPDAIFVHTIRNGYDASLSIEQYWLRHAHGVRAIAPGRVTARLKEVNLRRLPAYGKEVARRLAPAPLRPLFGRNVWGPRIPGIQQLLRDLDLIEVAALQWRFCVEQACAYGRTLSADRYMETRLEDLSEGKVHRILDFIDLPEDDAVMTELREEFDKDAATARTRQAAAAKLDQLKPWVEPTMAWLESTVGADHLR